MNKIRKNRDSIANLFDEQWFTEYQNRTSVKILNHLWKVKNHIL